MRQPPSCAQVSLAWQLERTLSVSKLCSFVFFCLCLSLSVHPVLSYSIGGPVNSPTAGGVFITVTGAILQPISIAVGITSCASLVVISIDSVACRVASGTGAGLNVTAFTHTFPFYFSYDPPLVSKCSGVSAAGGMVHVTGKNFGTSELLGHRSLRIEVSGIEVFSRWLNDSSLVMMAPYGAGRTMDFTVRLHHPTRVR